MDEAKPRRLGRINKRWVPAKWEPIYEQWVALSAMGLSNKDIAERFGYTATQVSNVLVSPKAKIVKDLIIRKVREGMLAEVSSDRTALTIRAHNNVKEVLNNDELLEKSPFKMLEASMKFLQGVGQLEGEKTTKQTIMINTQVANILQQGIQKAEEVKKLHNPAA